MGNILRLLILSMALATYWAPADCAERESKREVHISVGNYPTETEKLIWTAYGIALGDWVRINKVADTAAEGPFIPSYEADLHARQGQLKILRELNQSRPLSLKYANDMKLVESAGFLREYVWAHHRRAQWGAPPSDLRVESFLAWEPKTIPGHVPQTGAHIVFGPVVAR